MRIAIVNDSTMATEILRRCIASAPEEYRLAWVAADGAEAVDRCRADLPDLILMDILMPVMNGVEATRRIMQESPCGILIVTSSIDSNAPQIFEALAAGALDVTYTPGVRHDPQMLLKKIKVLSRVTENQPQPARPAPLPSVRKQLDAMPLVAIGASAGGPAALAEMLPLLPSDLGAGIVIVQHIDAQFAEGLAAWLGAHGNLSVRVALEGDRPERGVALIAATNDHIAMRTDGRLIYDVEPRQASYRPSVDVFFETAALHWRGPLIGVVLTGMGRDGVNGLRAIQRAGGTTLVQDQATSVVYGMPKAAAEAGVAREILPLGEIGQRIAAVVAEMT